MLYRDIPEAEASRQEPRTRVSGPRTDLLLTALCIVLGTTAITLSVWTQELNDAGRRDNVGRTHLRLAQDQLQQKRRELSERVADLRRLLCVLQSLKCPPRSPILAQLVSDLPEGLSLAGVEMRALPTSEFNGQEVVLKIDAATGRTDDISAFISKLSHDRAFSGIRLIQGLQQQPLTRGVHRFEVKLALAQAEQSLEEAENTR